MAEIDELQSRDGRRLAWERIRMREGLTEWEHTQHAACILDTSPSNGVFLEPPSKPLRVLGARLYTISPASALEQSLAARVVTTASSSTPRSQKGNALGRKGLANVMSRLPGS